MVQAYSYNYNHAVFEKVKYGNCDYESSQMKLATDRILSQGEKIEKHELLESIKKAYNAGNKVDVELAQYMEEIDNI